MRFIPALTITAALVSSALCSNPRLIEQRAEAIERRNARRAERFHSSAIDTAEISTSHDGKAYTSKPKRKSDQPGGWGGAVLYGQSGIRDVKTTFVVPSPSKPANGVSSSKYGGAAWVGIDGYGTGELWQTGITWTIENGTPGFSAWYEWVPGPYTSFENFAVHAGDTVTIEVVAHSSTSGTAKVTNKSTGISVKKFLSGQPALPQQSAEWIVEDFQSGAEPVPFASYNPAVQFQGCSYTSNAGTFGIPAGATLLEIGQDQNNPYTSCSINVAASSLTCARTGAQS